MKPLLVPVLLLRGADRQPGLGVVGTGLALLCLIGCGGGSGGGRKPAPPARELDGLLDVRFQSDGALINQLILFPVNCIVDCPAPDFRPDCGRLFCAPNGNQFKAYDGAQGPIPFVDVPGLQEGFYHVLVNYESGGIRNNSCFSEGNEFLEIEALGDQLLYDYGPCAPVR